MSDFLAYNVTESWLSMLLKLPGMIFCLAIRMEIGTLSTLQNKLYEFLYLLILYKLPWPNWHRLVLNTNVKNKKLQLWWIILMVIFLLWENSPFLCSLSKTGVFTVLIFWNQEDMKGSTEAWDEMASKGFQLLQGSSLL